MVGGRGGHAPLRLRRARYFLLQVHVVSPPPSRQPSHGRDLCHGCRHMLFFVPRVYPDIRDAAHLGPRKAAPGSSIVEGRGHGRRDLERWKDFMGQDSEWAHAFSVLLHPHPL